MSYVSRPDGFHSLQRILSRQPKSRSSTEKPVRLPRDQIAKKFPYRFLVIPEQLDALDEWMKSKELYYYDVDYDIGDFYLLGHEALSGAWMLGFNNKETALLVKLAFGGSL